MKVTDKTEEARKIISSLAKDVDKVLSMVQFSVPAGENVAKKVMERMDEIKKLFGVERGEDES